MPSPHPPAHSVIERHLRELVAAAMPGDQLPSDRELARQFNVSRMTARQAVGVLVGDGKVYRVTGSGTYVAENPVHRRVTRLLSFSEHMRRQGRVASAVVLQSRHRRGSRQENADLGQSTADQVGVLQRILKGDQTPIAIEDVLLPADCMAVLDLDLADHDLYEALAGIDREPMRAKGTLSAESANPELARLLDVAVGAALIVQRQVVLDNADRPVQLAVTRYVGDRFVFDIDQEKHVYSDPIRRDGDAGYEVRALGEV